MNEKISYEDFVEQISQRSGYDEDSVRDYLSNMFETVVTQSTKGNSVKIRNFGSFQPRWYKAKKGINPQTGQPLIILPHYHIHFASSKVLEDAVNDESSRSFLFKVILVSLIALLIAIAIYFMSSSSEPETVEPKKQTETTQVANSSENKVIEPVFEEEKEVQTMDEPEELIIQKPEVIVQEPIHETKPKQSKAPLYPGTHTVLANETLSEVGSKIYGTKKYWPLLYTANISKVVSPDLILKDSTLKVPDKKESRPLYSSYIDVHKAYLKQDKMGKSFWILCEGAKIMGKDFKKYLEKKLTPADYAIIEVCSPKGI